MNSDDSLTRSLLRRLDGTASAEERAALDAELIADPQARAQLRELAEQAVAVAEFERTAAARAGTPEVVPFPRPPTRRVAWLWAAAAAAVLLLGFGAFWLRAGGRELARVTKVTGASGFFGTRGSAERPVPVGATLRAGDMVETRSCDSWIELELRDGSKLTVAGHSALRLGRADADAAQLSLEHGNLWRSPATDRPAAPLTVRTPTAVLESGDALFNLQATDSESIVRVNAGLARVTGNPGGSRVEIPAGSQVRLALAAEVPLAAEPQPAPMTSWTCDMASFPAVAIGRWLPTEDDSAARLGAEPLLWPVPDRPPVMLHVVGISAFRTTGRPVELRAESRVRFVGRTQREHTVRFGFSTQKMRGVFAGKFEVDVPARSLAPAGQTWTVDLPVSDLRPLHPELSATPDGLEITDIYALTVIEDAGLELQRIEVLLP